MLESFFIRLRDARRWLVWWQHGLAQPWVSTDEPIVFGLQDQTLGLASIDENGNPNLSRIHDDQSDVFTRRSGGVYLLMPHGSVIVTKITSAQRNLPARDIALESLPFTENELVAVTDNTQTQLYCILKTDIQQEWQRVERVAQTIVGRELSLMCQGVAVVTDSGWVTADVDVLMGEFEGANQQQLNTISVSLRPLLAGISLLFAVLLGLGAASDYAKHQQLELRAQVALLKAGTPAPMERFSLQTLKQGLLEIRSRSSADTLLLLNQLLDALSLDVDISQLIISHNELLIDANADNATGLQLALKNLPAFKSVEFIAGISTDAANARERFRLKAVLAEPSLILNEDVPLTQDVSLAQDSLLSEDRSL